MPPTPPEQTPEQRAHALELALIAREERAELKRMVASGNLDPVELLEQGHYGTGDHAAGRIAVGDVLLAIDGVGPKHAAQILTNAGLLDDRQHLNALTRDEVDRIVAALP